MERSSDETPVMGVERRPPPVRFQIVLQLIIERIMKNDFQGETKVATDK
jgi:hypothetical protein